LAALLLALGVVACTHGHGGRFAKPAAFYNVRKIGLTELDKKFLLAQARATLTGGPAPNLETGKAVTANEARGVFVTAARPTQAALTAYAWGGTIGEATIAAASTLKRLGPDEDFAKLALRIDVIDESTDEAVHEKKAPWKVDPATQGLLLATTPPIALLPQEIKDWGLVDRHGNMNRGQFEKLVKNRRIGYAAGDEVFDAKTLKYARFTALSFMEAPNGEVLSLRHGNRTEGFEPTPDSLRRAIVAGAEYLHRGLKENGQFDYLYNPQLQSSAHSYNELRHAGTIFALTQVYALTQDPEVMATIDGAMKWVVEHTKGPDNTEWQGSPWAAFFDEHLKLAKLGGAGLALLAFSRHAAITGRRDHLPMMEGYARFIESLAQPDGNMKMRYYPNPADEDKAEKDVLYYPGESFFGLLALHALDHNPKWVEIASKGIDYIADVRDAKLADAAVPFDHWLCYAIEEVHKVKPKDSQVKHGWRIFKAMNERFNAESSDPDVVGGYYKTPNSVGAACPLEGTAALYRLAKQLNDRERMDEFWSVLRKGATYLMRNQYNDVNTMFFAEPKKALGGFMMSYASPEIQIDYVQHTLSALIATLAIGEERGWK
jgi:hypothetical protein